MTNEELSAALEHCKSDAGRDSCADLALRCHKAEAENARLAALVERQANLLKRISGWDHMDSAGDGAYWRSEITALLAALGEPTTTDE